MEFLLYDPHFEFDLFQSSEIEVDHFTQLGGLHTSFLKRDEMEKKFALLARIARSMKGCCVRHAYSPGDIDRNTVTNICKAILPPVKFLVKQLFHLKVSNGYFPYITTARKFANEEQCRMIDNLDNAMRQRYLLRMIDIVQMTFLDLVVEEHTSPIKNVNSFF
ncbi:hypothetical protein CEXT_441971 [Caerostris extrusa]|uniref:Uncharacterized protein n=1 Tax=Caerostris extrusa TaxID=172846 RepID=A0AAV4WGY8_CAEEX|nr:hypothetical protein CEXT_441971 [Caerostris extrusa]